jgi:hypothetical protein
LSGINPCSSACVAISLACQSQLRLAYQRTLTFQQHCAKEWPGPKFKRHASVTLCTHFEFLSTSAKVKDIKGHNFDSPNFLRSNSIITGIFNFSTIQIIQLFTDGVHLTGYLLSLILCRPQCRDCPWGRLWEITQSPSEAAVPHFTTVHRTLGGHQIPYLLGK